MEDEEDEDWESFYTANHHSPFSDALSPPSTTALRRHHHHHSDDVSIFPPINHEGLHPIPPSPPPPRAPLSLSSSDSDSDSDFRPSSPSPKPHFTTWVDFALHVWNSKLKAFVTRVGSVGLVWSFRLAVGLLPFLAGFWFWVWQRTRRRCGGREESERVEQLKVLIREKDERITQLLEQIAQMNKLLLARYRIPVIKTS